MLLTIKLMRDLFQNGWQSSTPYVYDFQVKSTAHQRVCPLQEAQDEWFRGEVDLRAGSAALAMIEFRTSPDLSNPARM